MDFAKVNALVGRLGGTLKFFPSDPDARIGIAEQIAGMAADEDQVRWLVQRLPQLFQGWPGMLEVRAVFCTRYKPRDGVEAALGTGSPAFAALCAEDEDKRAQIAVPRTRQLTGEVASVSDDPEMRDLLRGCVKGFDPLAGVKRATEAEIEAIKAAQNANRKESQPHEAQA